MKEKILIITQTQFGYHVDSFQYCKYLSSIYEITFLCCDYQLPKFYLQNIRVIYVPRDYSLVIRNCRFIASSIRQIRKNYDLVLVKYFHGSSILRLFGNSKPIVINVRSGYVSPKAMERTLRDLLLKFEVLFFKYRTIISQDLAARINISDSRSHILPLGSDGISTTNKTFESLDLLYVGTLSQRRIIDTVKGVHEFYTKHKGVVQITYTIVGRGYRNEVQEIEDYIKSNCLEEVINVVGYIPYHHLGRYFDSHNVGIAYIPITDYFDCQPPTKTYDYILSGMAVLATATSENAKIITRTNGILIEDNHHAFYEGLCEIYKCRETFQSTRIRETGADHTWKKIINNNLLPYIKNVLVESNGPCL